MTGGPQSVEWPCLAPPVRERGENTEGKENNLNGRNSTTADLQPDTKHTPGTAAKAAGSWQEEKLLSTP